MQNNNKVPNNINELREDLLDAYASLKADPRRHNQVKELANVAGKVLQATKLKMEFAYLKGEEPDDEFLGKTSGKPLKANAKLLT